MRDGGPWQTYSCQTGNINASEESRDTRCGLVGFAKPFKTSIRNGYTSFFWIYSSIREVGGLSEI